MTCGRRPEHAHHPHRQRHRAGSGRRLGRREPALRPPRAHGAARREERLRAGGVRLLHRLPRRRAGLRLPGGRRPGDRPRGGHGRGAGGRRTAASRAGGVRRVRRRAVRVLHSWARRRRARPARARAATVGPGDPRGAGGQPVPLHGLREDPRRGPAGLPSAGTGMSTDAGTRPTTDTVTPGRIGDSPLRPDGTLKVTGEFAYASDLWHDEMIWGVTLRSPHPHARIRRIDITEALTVPGVWAVLTADDVPGENAFGLEHADQPVLASEFVRYEGEPVALVAADHPETARRAAKRIVVDYEVLPAVTDPRRAMDPDAPAVHRPG